MSVGKRIQLLQIILLICSVNCARKKPNIFFILADDLGWNDVSYHGADQIPTPNIDALGFNGVILNSHYSQSICTPSRASLLTGKHPIHTGMQHLVLLEPEPRGLPLTETLMPEYFRDAGYVTHAIGKWHLGYHKHEYTPLYRGFDTHFGYMNGVQDYFSHLVYASLNESMYGYDMRRNMNVDYSAKGKYSTTLFTDEAVKLIEEHDKKKPMFMYLAHLAAHTGNRLDPLQAPDEEIAKFTHIPDPQRRIYAAMVSLLDKSIGDLVTALRKNHMLDNSIIVFISDNGAQTVGAHHVNHGSNYPLKGLKITAWEGGHRVPALIWSPLIKKNQRVTNQFMHITDWLPTLASAAGIPLKNPQELDGKNMWETISKEEKSPRTEMLYNIDDIFNYSAIRRGDWKYILGTVGEGKQDGWYGDTGKGPQYSYDPQMVLNSNVGVALTGFVTDQQIQEKQELGIINSFSYKLLNEKKIWELRNESTIICNKSVDETSNHRCNSLEAPCLFNLKDDPCEQVNLASERPIIVKNLENAINALRKTVVAPSNVPQDPNADPALWNGVWTYWRDCDYISKRKIESTTMSLTSTAVLGVLCTVFFIVALILIALSVRSSSLKKDRNNEGYALNTNVASHEDGDKEDFKENYQIYELSPRKVNDPKNVI